MKTILVPLDGSPLSERALPLACALAHDLGLTLQLLHVREPSAALQNARDSQGSFQAATWHVRQQYGLDPNSVTRAGQPAQVIAAEAAQNDVWAVAMASHSRDGLLRAVLGSVAEQIVDLAPVPVFLVPASVDAPGLPRFRRVLVPLDGSKRAEAILGPVNQLAKSLDAEVLVLRVFQPVEEGGVAPGNPAMIGQVVDGVTPKRRAAVNRNERGKPKTVEKVEFGDAAHEIVAMCESEHVDLVAFATHGRSRLDRDSLSAVAEAVLRHSRVPLMVFGREALGRLA